MKAARLAESSAAILTLGAEMIECYARLKESHAALDYEDLVLAARHLLETPGIAPWVLFKLDGGIDHILVDEAQDTNPAQWKIIELLAEEFFVGEGARPGPRTVFAVGDVKQSIFSFQGADPEAFVAMRRHFDRRLRAMGSLLEEVPLTISFRSTEAVLAAVDAIFAQAPAQPGSASTAGPSPIRRQGWARQAMSSSGLWPSRSPASPIRIGARRGSAAPGFAARASGEAHRAPDQGHAGAGRAPGEPRPSGAAGGFPDPAAPSRRAGGCAGARAEGLRCPSPASTACA
jgi:ATP-dependent exoDNAse (exonuclease V) beta subunit (contains helicase and exonuclease domains)